MYSMQEYITRTVFFRSNPPLGGLVTSRWGPSCEIVDDIGVTGCDIREHRFLDV